MGKKETAWRQITQDLSSRMGRFTFGQRFYTLAEICEKYDVSQITARRVLKELQNAGKVGKIGNGGTVVKNISLPCVIHFVMPYSLSAVPISSQAVIIRLYAGVFSSAKALNVKCFPVVEDHLTALSFDPKEKHGFLIHPSRRESTLGFLRKNKYPFVFLHSPLAPKNGSPVVTVDRKQGGYLATRHLLSLGHKRIGFISGSFEFASFQERWKGYRKALKEWQIEYDPRLIMKTPGDVPEEDEAAIEDLLRLPEPPTAVFAANDYRAINILNYCRRNKIRVPEDLSLAGYDNIRESALTRPPLTTVDTHLETIGEKGVSLLVQMMHEPDKQESGCLLVAPNLVVRNSTGRPR